MKKLNFDKRLTEIWVYPKINKLQDEYNSTPDFMNFLEEKDDSKKVRLYVHFPFCNSFCFFCPYYKVRYENMEYDQKKIYFDHLIKEINMYAKKEFFKGKKVCALYFGGGDPALVEVEFLERIMDAIYSNFDMSECKSFTSEGHVWSLNRDDFIDWFKKAGGTRVSFGIQTFKESLRKKVFLKPSEKEIFDLADKLRSKGIDDYTFDMIYNFPDQNLDDIETDAIKSMKLEPSNIDIHACNFYPNTAFSKAIQEKKIFTEAPSDEKEVAMFKLYSKIFRENGYNHIHAISFSKRNKIKYDGFEDMMRGVPHIGFGPSGRSYLADRSFRNITDIKQYIQMIGEGKYATETGSVSTEREKIERIMVFFPIYGWITRDEIPNDPEILAKVDNIVDSGYAFWDGDKLQLNEEGLLYAGNICKYFTNDVYQMKYMEGYIKCLKNNLNPYNQDSMGISKRSAESGK